MKKNDIIAVINKILDNCYTKLTDDEQNVIHDIIEAVDENGTLNRIIQRQDKELSRLTAENAELCATLSEMETVEARLDNAGKFPCKVGDTIYQTDTNGTKIFKSTVKGIIFETDGVAFDERAIGESIFLTEEAVKEKMKKLQEKNND